MLIINKVIVFILQLSLMINGIAICEYAHIVICTRRLHTYVYYNGVCVKTLE